MSTTAATRKRSSIWSHFTSVTCNTAKCDICHSELSYKGGSTTNLLRHLKTKHPLVQPGANRSQLREEAGASALAGSSTRSREDEHRALVPTRSSASLEQSSASSSAVSPARQDRLNEALAKMIVMDYQPFSVVQDKGFRAFINQLNPSYVLPNRKALTRTIIPQLYERTLSEVQEKVKGASAVCLTTDCWTSVTHNGHSYLSVTSHFINPDFQMSSCLLDCFGFADGHTAANLKDELLRIAADWNIQDKVVAVVSDDDAANMTEAIRLTGWNHLPCFAHTIDLVVREALQEIRPTVDKVKVIVEYVRRSPAAAEKLRSLQKQLGMEELKLKQEVARRWNSTYRMLTRFHRARDAVVSMLALVDAALPTLTPEEWDTVAESCGILKPFDEAVAEISPEKTVSASKVIILARGLQRIAATRPRNAGLPGPVARMLNALQAAMSRRFDDIERQPQLAEASLLDPRFKRRAFTDERAAEEAVSSVAAAAGKVHVAPAAAAAPAAVEAPGESDREAPAATRSALFWRDFDDCVSHLLSAQTPSSEAALEVKSFLEEPLLARTAEPLQWWASRRPVYQRLSRVTSAKLCVVTACAPCRRSWSKTGQVAAERRNHFSPSKVREIVFLNANLD